MSDKSGNKYGNIDELLAGVDSDVEVTPNRSRSRRPSPALAVMTGDNRPISITEGLKAEKQKAEIALKDAQDKFEKEKENLLSQLEISKSSNSKTQPIILTMPVTKQEISFEFKWVDPSLIDVSPENERIQDFIDEISLQDILPDIKINGQQKPGTLRPKSDGRYELIEGSRRLACAKYLGQQYLALIGDVPDEDVRELGIIENKSQKISPYEKAKAYQRQIDLGEYENWTKLGSAKEISSSHISRYRACAELDEIYVRILKSPSEMPLSYGEMICKLKKRDEMLLLEKAQELIEIRKSQPLSVEQIIKYFKAATKKTIEQPQSGKPVVYKSNNGATLKHSITNRGSTKLEIAGIDDLQREKILDFLVNSLKLEK